MDADLQHPPELLPKLWAELDRGADLVVGSRYACGGCMRGWKVVRQLISRVAIWMTLPVQRSGIRARDPMSGFFMVRRACIDRVELQKSGFKILLEILARAEIRSVVEVPFTFGRRHAGASKANLRVAIDYVALLVRLYRQKGRTPSVAEREIAASASGQGPGSGRQLRLHHFPKKQVRRRRKPLCVSLPVKGFFMSAPVSDSVSSALIHPWNPAGSGSVDVAGSGSLGRGCVCAAIGKRLGGCLAAEGPRTIESTLRAYDDAVAELAAVGSLTGLMHSVYPEKTVRDTAQALLQKISQAGVELSLNRDVYQALEKIDASGADAATRHYLDRTLLQYRLAGVDKDDATRAKIKELQDQATLTSLNFGRNVQEGGNTVTVEDAAELDGLPADFLEAHQPGEDGKITLTTDFPDYLPVLTFARSSDLRRRMFLAYNTRAYPANRQLLLDLLRIRQEVATILGFAHWADLATADQMMESAANMQAFLDDLDHASKGGAEKEYAMILEFAQSREPGLRQIDAASRAYWLEQYRRSAFDFDSQSVRPYFPYTRVEPGVLATAEKLFQVQFRRIENPDVWHPSVSAWEVWDGTEAGGAVLSRHASARGQGQVVLGASADSRHSGSAVAGGSADLQFS